MKKFSEWLSEHDPKMTAELSEEYVGFAKLKAKVAAGGTKNPGAVAAAIGRKKYGKKKFQKHAAKGKKMKGCKPKGKK